jgi:hypothetical protein
MTAEPPVGVVLDTASMLAFARGDGRVAELIVETASQGAVVGVPAVALLAAHVEVRADEVARGRLGVLAVLPAVRVLPMTAAVVREVAVTGPEPADLAGMHTAWATAAHGAYYVTADAGSVPAGLPAWQVVTLADHVG